MHTLDMMLLILLLLPLATGEGDGRAVGGDRNPSETRRTYKRRLQRPARRMVRSDCTPCGPNLCCRPGLRCGTSTLHLTFDEPACLNH
uniref:Conotoxin superfamily Q n=1 Tax=Conus ermineus TaxID=55423 RepID=A0A346CIG9_CONER|nr:conotoxin precursor superfamily Q [Conus ermineus]